MKSFSLLMMGIFLSVILFSCRESYTPPQITTPSNYLVVEGLINTSPTDTTTITLSRTINLNSKTTTKAETKAIVTIESDANNSYPLKEIKTGTYITPPPGLSKTAKYRLRIITTDGKTYLSDFTLVKESPVIDSLTYTQPANGLQVNISTHDATNNTRYYRYEYVETWQYESAFGTSFMFVGGQVVDRPPAKQIFDCWQSNNSADIVLASSAKLTQDVIANTPVTTVPRASEKLKIDYSILVKQYALTQDAFNFWQNLKKNTEQLGSIFDAEPSTIQGNIHNVNNSAEPVFGYVSAGTVQQKRIFVRRIKLTGDGWATDDPNKTCRDTSLMKLVLLPGLSDFVNGTRIPLAAVYNNIGILIGYTGNITTCVDCTTRGGTNHQPSFWQ
ncbi:MAG: hypothetical protein JWQ79_2885 [Mucilaginibacter sp.]|nr:hypothetical protein [Mucilaginibacter sp.]